MKGDFNEAVQFIRTFDQKIEREEIKKFTLKIYKQKLYELLQNPEEVQLRNLFEKQIINVCSEDEYQHLFTLLTCRSVKQIQGMDSWTPAKGRYACFEEIAPSLEKFFHGSMFQKNNNKPLDCNLEDIIESYLSADQKKNNLGNPEAISRRNISTDKQSIEEKVIKKQQTNMFSKVMGKSIYKPIVSPQSEYRPTEIQISQSMVQKSQGFDKSVISQEEDGLKNITYNKKWNTFMGNNSFNKTREGQMKKPSNMYANESLKKETQGDYEQEEGRLRKAIPPPSYLKEFQKQPNDSDVFQEEVRKNIAYLDQNNSVVYKDDENENFTFSHGAEESGLQDKQKKIFKLATVSDSKAIRTCQFSPSGNYFALGTNSSFLKIFQIQELFETNEPRDISPIYQIPQLHTKSIFCLDWSSNEKAIATCSNDLTVKVTDFLEGVRFSSHRTSVIGRHESCIRMVKFNSLETKIVSCGDDSLIKVWDIGKVKKCSNLKGHEQSVSAFRFAQLEQDNILYSVSKDSTIRKWDLRISQCVSISQPQDSEITYIANHIDRIVTSHKNGCVSFFNSSLQMQHSIQVHEQEIRSIDGMTYDDLLLTASFDGHISIFSEKTSESPNYHQHNELEEDKVVFATFMNHPEYHGFASTSTLGLCNIFAYD